MKGFQKKIKSSLSEKLALYPVLTGILFLLNELRKNGMYYSIREIVSLVFIVLVFTFFIDYVAKKIILNRNKASLIAALIIFLNLFYLDVFRIISSNNSILSFLNVIPRIHLGVIIFSVLILIWSGISFIVLRAKIITKEINLYFNLLLITFILVEIIKWIFIVQYPKIELAEDKAFLVNTSLQYDQKPDIYYIILDSYTSSGSLKKYWNYDNSDFEESLRKLGFFIAGESTTRYISTPCCMASYLNSSFLRLDSTEKYNYWNLNFLNLIKKNRLFSWLQGNGYLCYNFSLFDSFGRPKYLKGYSVNHFLSRTIWYAISAKLYHHLKPSSELSHINLSIFHEINILSAGITQKPLFVYAHVNMPHAPFFFDKEGNSLNQSEITSNKQAYLGQLLFTNKLTLNSVNNILQHSRKNVVIIIQGDHGYRSLEDTSLIEQSNESHTIFNAIYYYGGISLSNSLNPSDTFKKIIEKINTTTNFIK
jgi:hypothetical protein